jgi:hypothetical protein
MTMRLITAIVLVSLVLGCTKAGRVAMLDIPVTAESMVVSSIDLARYDSLYQGYDGVYLSIDRTVEHSGQKEASLWGALLSAPGGVWSYGLVHKEDYLILNPEASDLTIWRIGYKPDKCYLRVQYPNGSVKLYGKADLQEVKLSKYFSGYQIAIPNVVRGTRVTLGYEDVISITYYMPPLEEDFHLQYFYPCEKLSFSFGYPNWWTVQVKNIAAGVQVPYDVNDVPEKKKIVLSYSAVQVPALKAEPFSPPYKLVAPYLQLRVTNLTMGDFKPDLIDGWGELAKRYRKYLFKKVSKTSDQLSRVTDSVVTGKITADEKIEAITSFVANTIDLTWEDNDADPRKTLKLKKGSAADAVGLAQAMLAEAGTFSDIILVHDVDEGYYDPQFISPSQFGTMGLLVTADGTKRGVFPLSKYVPSTLTPVNYLGQCAISVDEVTSAREIELPYPDSNWFDVAIDAKIVIDTLGEIAVEERHVSSKLSACEMRAWFEEYRGTDLEKWLKTQMMFGSSDVVVDTVIISSDSIRTRPFEYTLRYRVRNAVTITPDEIIAQTSHIRSLSGNDPLESDTTKRRNPVYAAADHSYSRNITISVPSGYHLPKMPAPISVSNSLGSLVSEYQSDDKGVTISQRATLLRGTRPKKEYPRLLEILGPSSGAAIPSLVFEKLN